MDYFDIGKHSKRVSFESKMATLNYHSSQLIDFSKNIVNIDLKKTLPRELETLLTFFVISKEYPGSSVKQIEDRKFVNMINAIKDHTPKQVSDGPDEALLNRLLISSLQQFEVQEVAKYVFYRYNYFFTFINENINMTEIFKKKFNIPFERFVEFALNIEMLFFIKNKTSTYFKYAFSKYKDVIRNLLITRDDYIDKIDFFTQSVDLYSIGIKPCNSFPFIECNGDIYLPLPHCIIPAITHSLFLRLTDKNNKIKNLFGKNVYENYLFDILKEAEIFDETLGEFIYGKEHKRTPDVMCRKGNKYVFYEAKSMVPYFDTRCLNKEKINSEIDKISDAIRQLYNQIELFCNGEYNFFEEQQTIDKSNCFGIVVLLKDSFISRKEIYLNFANKNNISVDSLEYKWVINHIKIVSIYEIERYAFTSSSIIKAIEEQIDSSEPYNHSFVSPERTTITNLKLKNYNKKNKQCLENFGKELSSLVIL